MDLRVADDAALPHVLPSCLELRLDEDERLPAGPGESERRRKRRADGDEGDVGHDELGRERELAHRARVRPLEHRDPRVVAQARVQLAVAHVEGDHPRRPALQEHVRESTRGRADVQGVPPANVEAEHVERVLELLAPARDEPGRPVERQLLVVVHLSARLVEAGHEARHDQGLRLRTRLREPALHQQDVQPLLHRFFTREA